MKIKLLAATALVLTGFTPVAVLPAFAQTSAEQTALNQFCRDLIAPGAGVGNPFEYTAIRVEVGDSTPGGSTMGPWLGEHRRGGSPNIFNKRLVTTTASSTSFTFDCQTRNPNAGGQGEFPQNFQLEGLETTLQTGTSSSGTQVFVVCNSPGSNKGSWRGQNGYSNPACETLGRNFYLLAIQPETPEGIDASDIPSNSLPSS
jgi:hypothetical protein